MPAANYNGTDNFTYRVNDGVADSNVVTVAISISAVTDAPTAVDNSYTKSEDMELYVAVPGVLGNDRAGDNGGGLTATLTSGTSHGTVELNPDGSFTYVPEANFNGTDSFTYQAHDNAMASNSGIVTITVSPVNDSPRAPDDSYSTNEDSPLTVAAPGVLANDTDIDSAVLTAVRLSGPSHGTLALALDGGFTYTPNPDYYGPDTFTYRVRDAAGASDYGIVTLMVNLVEDAPVANSQAKAVTEDTRKAVTLTASDVDSAIPIFVIVTPPAHGTLGGTLPFLTYDPEPNYVGPDSFTFRVTDDTGLDSNVATVSLTVTPVNDAPVAQAADYTTPVNTTLIGQLVAADVDGDPLTYAVTQHPTKGSVSVDPATGVFTYVPSPGKTGTDSFKFKANDGKANSNMPRIQIQIR